MSTSRKWVGRHGKWCGVHLVPVLLRNPGKVREAFRCKNHAQSGCTRQFLPGARTMGKFRRRRPIFESPLDQDQRSNVGDLAP